MCLLGAFEFEWDLLLGQSGLDARDKINFFAASWIVYYQYRFVVCKFPSFDQFKLRKQLFLLFFRVYVAEVQN